MSPHGLLIVDKPGGITSHDVVAQARKYFGTRAVGHAGTLDPMATGVLLLLFGEATKLSLALTSEHKRYLTTISFGRATDSFDADGVTTEETAVAPGLLEGAAVERALDGERARSSQLPPAVSALKVAGQRAHALVRAGETPLLAERPVRVDSLRVLASEPASLTLELCVSRGYYVRALARDLGAALGVPAHLSALRRLASGVFEIAEATPWPPAAPPQLMSVATAAQRAIPSVILTSEGERRARLGQALSATEFESLPQADGVSAWLSSAGALLALGAHKEAGEYRVVRGFQPELTLTSATNPL